MAHVLEIAQRRSNLIKGVLLLLCLFLDLLTILICRCSHDMSGGLPGVCYIACTMNIKHAHQALEFGHHHLIKRLGEHLQSSDSGFRGRQARLVSHTS